MNLIKVNELAEEGKQLFQGKKYLEAAGKFSEAVNLCMQDNDRTTAAEIKNNQSVALLQAKKYQASLEAVTGTDLVFGEAGDLRRQGMALANQAAALEGLKRHEEAIAIYAKSAALLEQAGEDQMRADVLRSVANLQAKHGKMTDMVFTEQDALLGVKNPTLKQRILKKLMMFVFWKWKRKI